MNKWLITIYQIIRYIKYYLLVKLSLKILQEILTCSKNKLLIKHYHMHKSSWETEMTSPHMDDMYFSATFSNATPNRRHHSPSFICYHILVLCSVTNIPYSCIKHKPYPSTWYTDTSQNGQHSTKLRYNEASNARKPEKRHQNINYP